MRRTARSKPSEIRLKTYRRAPIQNSKTSSSCRHLAVNSQSSILNYTASIQDGL